MPSLRDKYFKNLRLLKGGVSGRRIVSILFQHERPTDAEHRNDHHVGDENDGPDSHYENSPASCVCTGPAPTVRITTPARFTEPMNGNAEERACRR